VASEGHSGTINGFIVCINIHSVYDVGSRLQRLHVIVCEHLFLLSYSTGRTVLWCWGWPVSDS